MAADPILWEDDVEIDWEDGTPIDWEDGVFITATDLTNDRIYQVSAGNSVIAISFSGSYGGAAPASVEIKIVNAADSSTVQDWTAISSTSIGGGAWAGLRSVPIATPRKWYHFLARSKNSGGTVLFTTAETSNEWTVGRLPATAGQSNMMQMFTISSSPPATNTFTKMHTAAGWGPVVGNGAILFANLLSDALDCPIGLLNYAVGGAGLHAETGGFGYWMDLTAGEPYPLFATGLAAAGGDCEFFLWHQGETDAMVSISTDQYKTDMDTLYGRVRIATGRGTSTLKFGCAVLGRANIGVSNAAWDAIRQAHLEWIRDTTGAFYAGSSVDMTLAGDNLHYAGAAQYERMARRYAQAVLEQLGAVAFGAEGPYILSATWNGAAEVRVQIAHDAGTALKELDGSTDGGSVTGFQVSDDDFATTETISSTAFAGNEIVITLSGSAGAVPKVRYQYGQNPSITNPVYDNTTPQSDTIGLPLRPTIGAITDTAPSGLLHANARRFLGDT